MKSPQPEIIGLPYDVDRCKGVSYDENGTTEWREGCEHCLRRTSPPNPAAEQQSWIAPPTMITLFCEYLIEKSDLLINHSVFLA